ncbi:MAG: hypothetical protein RMK75_06730 [Aquificaceae bacterium]|nr:hypothetical protein [Aquificaceae bacterium]MDW8423997.1 hypothetical protein [Aquificaceae bacterium]
MDNRTHYSQCAIELVENSMEKAEVEGSIVKEVIADTGYDTHEIFRYLGGKGIKAVITGNRARDEVVRAIKKGKKK